MRIPEVRDQLAVMADDLMKMAWNLALDADELQGKAQQLRGYIAELKRRGGATKAAPTSAKLTATLKREIIAYAKAHPRMGQKRIAETFNVNIGRVSETLRGKRK